MYTGIVYVTSAAVNYGLQKPVVLANYAWTGEETLIDLARRLLVLAQKRYCGLIDRKFYLRPGLNDAMIAERQAVSYNYFGAYDSETQQQTQNLWRVPWKLWDGASPMKTDLILEVMR